MVFIIICIYLSSAGVTSLTWCIKIALVVTGHGSSGMHLEKCQDQHNTTHLSDSILLLLIIIVLYCTIIIILLLLLYTVLYYYMGPPIDVDNFKSVGVLVGREKE